MATPLGLKKTERPRYQVAAFQGKKGNTDSDKLYHLSLTEKNCVVQY